jgi:hypothetical protein
MAFTFQDKIDSMKLDRSLAINAKRTIISTRASVLEEDDFNKEFFTNEDPYQLYLIDSEAGSPVFTEAREDNLIDRASCESTTRPGILGETGAAPYAGTFARSDEQAYSGDYSYKLTASSTTTPQAYLCDASYGSADMHGVSVGETLELTAKFYHPSTGGLDPAHTYLRMGQYTGSWVYQRTIVGSVSTATDEWVSVSVSITIANAATGFNITIFNTAPAAGEYFYIDDIKLVRHSVPGSHYLSGGYGEYLCPLTETGVLQVKFRPTFAYDVASDQNLCGWYVSAAQYFRMRYNATTDTFRITWWDSGVVRTMDSAKYDDGSTYRNINQWITLTLSYDLSTGTTAGSSLWMNGTQDDTWWDGNIDAMTTQFPVMQIRAYDSTAGAYDIAYVKYWPNLTITSESELDTTTANSAYWSFGFNGTNREVYYGVNDLIFRYLRERHYLGGDTYSIPSYGDTMQKWQDDWDTELNLAISTGGDGEYGIYPTDENGATSQEINFESIILNSNGDSKYAAFTKTVSGGDTFVYYDRKDSFIENLSKLLNYLGDSAAIGDTIISGYSYGGSGDAIEAASYYLYGDSEAVGGTQYRRLLTGWNLLGRRTCNVKIETEDDGGSNYRYLINKAQTADQPDFYGDSIGDSNGFIGTIEYKTNFLTALMDTCLSGDTYSGLKESMGYILDALFQIGGIGDSVFGDTNIYFSNPDMNDFGDSYYNLLNIYRKFSDLIGDSGDSYLDGDSTLWGLYSYFSTASGGDSNFNPAIIKLLDICRNGDTSLESIAWGRYNSIAEKNLSEDAVVYYDFRDTGNTYVQDYSGDSRTGRIPSSDIIGDSGTDGAGAFFVASSSHYLSVGDSHNFPRILNTHRNWTLSMSVKGAGGIYQTSKYARIFSYGGDSNNRFELFVKDLTSSGLRMVITDGGVDKYLDNPTGFDDFFNDEWNNLTITCGDSGDITFYLNGDSVSTTIVSSYDIGDTISNKMIIGSSMFESNRYFDGSIDEFYLFPRKLSKTEVSNLVGGSLKKYYLGSTYKESEGDITGLRFWRLFWLKSIVGKPRGTYLSYNSLGTALNDASNQLGIATQQLQNTLGDSDYHHYQYIPTPRLLAAYFDAKRDQDTGEIIKRKVSIAYDGQQHATGYSIFRQIAPSYSSSTINNDQWDSSYIIAKEETINEETGFVKNIYTDEGDSFSFNTKYIYRVQTLDETDKVDGDTVKSLQSDLFDSDTETSFTCTPGDSKLLLGDSHDFEKGKYVVINGTNYNGYYLIKRIGDTEVRITPTINSSSGVLYKSSSIIFIQE